MEWDALEEAVAARLFASPASLESKPGSPSFGAVLFAYFLEYQTSNFKSTKPRSNAFFDFIQSDDAHFYLIFAMTFVLPNLKHLSVYHVFICVFLVTAYLFIFVNYLAVLFLENDIEWISRESRLLCAILEDAQGIKDLSGQIRSKAPEIWDSELASDQISGKAPEIQDSELGSDQIRGKAPEVWDSELGSDEIRDKGPEVRDSELGSDQIRSKAPEVRDSELGSDQIRGKAPEVRDFELSSEDSELGSEDFALDSDQIRGKAPEVQDCELSSVDSELGFDQIRVKAPEVRNSELGSDQIRGKAPEVRDSELSLDQIRGKAPEVRDSELGSDQIRGKAAEVRDSELGLEDSKLDSEDSDVGPDQIRGKGPKVWDFELDSDQIRSKAPEVRDSELGSEDSELGSDQIRGKAPEVRGSELDSDQIRGKAPEVRDSELGSEDFELDSDQIRGKAAEVRDSELGSEDSKLGSEDSDVGSDQIRGKGPEVRDSELGSNQIRDKAPEVRDSELGSEDSKLGSEDSDVGSDQIRGKGPEVQDSELGSDQIRDKAPEVRDSELGSDQIRGKAPKVQGSELDSDQIRSKAPEVQVFELNSSVSNAGLNESDVAWVNKTKIVVSQARNLVEDFEKKRKREINLRKMSLSMLDFTEVEELFKRTKQVKDALNGSIMMREIDVCGVRKIEICETLEKSWSTVRKLLDRPIEEQENMWIKSVLQVDEGNCVSSLVKKVHSTMVLIRQIKNLDSVRDRLRLYLEIIELQLMLLDPFLQHVTKLRLESAIGKAWLKEVDEIAGEAQLSLNAFLEATAYPVWWLRVPRIIKGWKAWRKFKAATRRIDVSFSELFERKERYGFKFIIRDSSKSSKYHSGDGKGKVLSVVNDIRYFLDQTSVQLGDVSSKLKSLCDQLENMCKLLDDAEATHAGINSLREAWFRQMEVVANSAVESKKAFWKNFTSDPGSYHGLSRTRARLQLSREIDQIKHRIHVIERSIRAYSIELREESSSVVGLEEDVDSLVSQLTAESSDQDCSCEVLSIVGMEGIGKTTLAKKVYSHNAIKNGFPIPLWINVPQKSEGVSFLKDVGKQIPGSYNPSLQEKEIMPEEEEYWKMIISDFLNKDRYFLVLDNVSTKEAWDTLVKLMVLKTSKGCRVLLTTRDEEVASLAGRDSSVKLPHRIRLRTKDESLNLLKQMVHISTGEEKIAEDIASGCLGLPLSIIRVGYMMLKRGRTASEALLKAPLLKSAFRKSDGDLKYLEHFELFPRDFEIPAGALIEPRNFEIPARRLIALWVSEGLVQESRDENQTLEQVAENHLAELVDQGIVQAVKRKANGKVKTCCLPITREPTSLKFSDGSAPKIQDVKSVQRLADHFDSKSHGSVYLIHSSSTRDLQDNTELHSFFRYDLQEDDEPREGIGFFLRKGKMLHDLHSFLSFDPREGTGEKIGNFLRRGIALGYFQGLHVLDLERVFRPELPKDIGKLKKLRYLGLRWTYLQSIPLSIGELVHLETLDLKHTYVHALPSSLWKLQRLRHLYLNQSNRSEFMQHPSGSYLKSLETLWGVSVDKNSPLKDCLDKMTNLRKLGLAFQLDEPEQRRITDRIMKLKHLQSLRLRSIDERSKPRKLFLKLSGLENLSSLDLFGKLENPFPIDGFPKQLTELTLSASGLSKDTMCNLGKLRNLKLLCFYSNSYSEDEMIFSDEDFPKLLVKAMEARRIEKVGIS